MSTFALRREYALQMPINYVEVDRDEMEYVDGGYYVDFSKDYLQYLVDGMLVVFGGVALAGGITSALRKFGLSAVANKICAVAIAAGMYVGIYPNQAKLLGIITGLLGVVGITPGWIVATAIDSVDKSGRNGRIQF